MILGAEQCSTWPIRRSIASKLPTLNRLVLADHGAAHRLYTLLHDHGFGEPFDSLA
jgi:hypothetical protein